MRILALAIFVIGTVSIGPAAAQTYDPAYPVCLQVYSRMGSYYYECSYTSLSVQRVGIGPLGTVRHQSLFRGRGRARALSAASPRLLKNEPYRPPNGGCLAAVFHVHAQCPVSDLSIIVVRG